MKFSICSLGCKVNNYEANWYRQQLSAHHQEVPFNEAADICIINSCTVTNTAGSKSRQMLHKARKLNPEAVICMVSCYVQMEYGNEGIFKDADILVGSRHKDRIPDLIEQFLKDRKRIVMVGDIDLCPFEEMSLRQYNQTRAYLKIQDGCNQFCSFCVIPFARGRERSLEAEKVVENASMLVRSGHREIVLTGIHSGRYNHGQTDFTALIKRLLKEVDGLERIRISSIEITEITDELLELMRDERRIARHLHIPLQAGSDKILKAMGRPYDTEGYLTRINEIRALVPSVSISCDIIAGFPAENDQDFAAAKQFVRDCAFSFLHVFPYAAKKHTIAASMKEQVPENIKRRRVSELTVLSDELYNTYIESLVKKEGEVLFEREVNGYWQGHNSEYVLVKVKSRESLSRQIRLAEYDEKLNECLLGHLKEKQDEYCKYV